ncbi:MAG: tetratricopeptide repeat protein, partial [Scytonema sp. RU_4_4]|nr:tetratricopeptide repeat protein [Scytonema sp. RU_4_4]
NFFSRRLPAVLMGATVVMVQPQLAVALSPIQISDIAKEFTVLITGEGIGSGVIFERKGDTYFVITNQHVVANDGRYEIQTADGSRYPVYRSQELPGLDIAILQFTSKKNYRLANLGNSDQVKLGMTVYVVGWTDSVLGTTKEPSYYITPPGIITSLIKNPEQGYGLVYSNEAIPGMSGGPVLDENGRVVGINSAADSKVSKQGTLLSVVRLGIPINMFLAARNRPAGSPSTAQQPNARPSVATTGQTNIRKTFARLKRAEVFISSGGAKAKRKDYQGAIADYNQALLINANNPDAYFRRSIAYYDLKKYQVALEDLNKVVQLSPKNAKAYNNRGVIRSDLGDKQAALSDINQAIQLDPKLAIAYYNRGNLRDDLGDKKAALADYNQAIQLDPKYASAYNNRGKIRSELGDKQAALADYNQAIQLDPKYADAYNKRGVIRAQSGDKQAALTDFNQIIQLNPKNATAYYNRGILRSELGDKQAALSDYNQAIQLDPKYASAYNNRGNIRYELGDKQAAIADYNQALRLAPNNAPGYFQKGIVYHFQGDYQRATAAYEKAIALDAKFIAAVNNIGLIKYEQGDIKGAIRQFQASIAIDKQSAEPQLALAVALYIKGEREKGLTMAQAALRSDSQFADVAFLKKNFWGDKLIADAKKLLENPKIREITSRPSRRQ